MVAVRFAAGVVGESRRQAHLAEAPDGDSPPALWPTLCGLEIRATLAEVSDRPAGMPCVRCLAAMTSSSPEELDGP
ncbi:hypothetical protein [Parasphingorhabdus pacifica]